MASYWLCPIVVISLEQRHSSTEAFVSAALKSPGILLVFLPPPSSASVAPILAPKLTLCHTSVSLPDGDEEEVSSSLAVPLTMANQLQSTSTSLWRSWRRPPGSGKVCIRHPAHNIFDADAAARLVRAYAAMSDRRSNPGLAKYAGVSRVIG
ncbi:hypothetical protein L7F22_038053 [Adiantum nelumboides]|nr:hypothetical protein [Adiantum nelumboides]